MSVNSKIFKILYRLSLPGGLLLVFAAVLIRLGLLADPDSPLVLFVPLMIYGAASGIERIFSPQPPVLCHIVTCAFRRDAGLGGAFHLLRRCPDNGECGCVAASVESADSLFS